MPTQCVRGRVHLTKGDPALAHGQPLLLVEPIELLAIELDALVLLFLSNTPSGDLYVPILTPNTNHSVDRRI
jgi:hypothetical protein